MLKPYSRKVNWVLFATLVFVVTAGYAQNACDLWVEMCKNSASEGGISNNVGESLFPAITIGRDGNPIVCWANDHGSGKNLRQQIYVKRWNGSFWVEMGKTSASGGGVSNNNGESTHPDIVIDRAGNPIICWRDEEGTRYARGQIYVKRWNGSSWVEMGEDSASGVGISNNKRLSSYPSIAIGQDGNPIVCWGQMLEDGNGEIRIKWWDGSAWRQMESIPVTLRKLKKKNDVPPVPHPEIATGLDGNPFICWSDYSSGNWEIYVKRWDGLAWVEVGTGSASGEGISSSAGGCADPTIAIDQDGRAIVCWEDRTFGNSEIYVKRWDGAAWVEMGKDSASRGGISHDSEASLHPDIAIGPNGNPVICWTSGEIYVRRWDGSSWIEVGNGSASGAGISNNIETSGNPAIAIASDGNPIIVFWNGTSDGDSEIYVRKASAL